MKTSTRLQSGVAALALIAAGVATPALAQDVTLEYWVYSDFAQGDALALQQEFISEFIAEHPGVTINITGKGDDDLTAGQVAGAASGTLPDVFMNAAGVGAQLVSVGALSNLYDQWMAMPEEYRAQFDEDALNICMPNPGELYCLPYTGFGSLLFRNLTVLEKAGIDTTTPPATWDEWLDQMKTIKEAGFYGIPDQTLVFNSIAATYAMAGDESNWGIDWETRTTKIDPEVMTKVLQMFVDMVPVNSGTSRNDQATKDLFISNQLAYHAIGPWVDPTYRQAAENGLDYDYVLLPSVREGDHGGIKSYEIIGVAPGDNQEIAFEFAAFITEKQQMVRWAKLLSRYNANAAAMADPEVADLPLIARSVESVKYALQTHPPYFVDTVPNCYLSTIIDFASATADGEYTPEEGAKEMIDELNYCLEG
ncbi:ABC transporter substrate-binding protein [Acuticoccus sp. M5D2P5]|uniref:ABC transporter substrate-binding protein n=1 Tax=Acuticoccus kalidii TaxID=2910977 RepID=UPI001F19FFDB|nr:ABC transporter substrate-binding protein [Acuticoccus kalidii]MCF3932094.1 ABC transporter substrate-binding protein [Acuticoccus kalidii]